jgi:membrane-associated phospholipid phosphatase
MPKRAVYAMAGAALSAGLLLLVWFLAFHVSLFRDEDAKILSGFAGLHGGRVNPLANWIAHLCNPSPFVYFAAGVVLVALLRRRPGVALVIALIIFGANVTTELLKPLLAAPRPTLPGVSPVDAASWPSGHATAAMSLALCAILAAPARLRPFVAALGAAFAVAVSYSFLTLAWHYPSDVFGGFLVATIWTLLGAAVLFTARARRTGAVGSAEAPSLREALRPPAAALLGALLLGGLVALARPHQVISYAQAHTAFVVGAAAIAAASLTLATAVMLALRR